MDALKKLENIGAILKDTHVIYTSGKHGSAYVNKDAVYPHTELTRDICMEMAKLYEKSDIDVVVAPAIGAVILSQWIAYHLSALNKREVLSVYAEKSGDDFVIKRGYDKLISQKNCLIVEDVVNTGGSLLKVIQQVKKLGGKIQGAVALCNRGGVKTSDLDNIPRLEALINVSLEAWDPSECPLCKKGIPINTNVGKGKA
jgi:orotate phosphoribosyltransferase